MPQNKHRAIFEAKDPKAEVAARLAEFRASEAENLLAPALERKNANWQEKDSHGTFTTGPGKGTDGGPLLVAESVSGGCFEPDADGWRRVIVRTPPAPEGMTGVGFKIILKQNPGERVEVDRAALFKK